MPAPTASPMRCWIYLLNWAPMIPNWIAPLSMPPAGRVSASLDPMVPGTDMTPLLDAILEYVPCPEGDPAQPAQMLISTIDYNEYVGRIGIGKIERGTIKTGDMVSLCTFGSEGVRSNVRVTSLSVFEGLKRVNVEEASAGEIVAVSGVADINIGDTLCRPDAVEPLPFVKITEPTVSMTFSVNDSPFAGKEGKYLTSRHLRARLYREIETDVSLRVEDTDSPTALRFPAGESCIFPF